MRTLDLDPITGARAAAVGRVGALGYGAFQSQRTRLLEKFRARAGHVDAETHLACCLWNEGAQETFSITQGHALQVVAVEVEQVEDEVDQSLALRIGQRVLQCLEAGPTAFIDDGDFAIEPCGFEAELAHGLGDAIQRSGPFLAVSREHRHLALVDAAEHAVAVELDFMQPFIAGRNGVDQRGEHRRKRGRQLGYPGADNRRHAAGALPRFHW